MSMDATNFNIVLPYNPVVASAPSTSNFVFTANTFNPLERDGFSTWDLKWRLPDIFSAGSGRWEYYCPDKLCPGPGWTQLQGPANIQQSWMTTNGLRWNPQGITSSAQYNLNGTFGLTHVTQQLTLSTTATPNNIANLPLPYANSPSCTARNLTFGGSNPVTFPWGTYTSQSPIRPLCATVKLNTGFPLLLGDVVVTATQSPAISVNAWYSLSKDIIKPLGFRPLIFTGTSSTTGVAESVLEFATSSAFEMLSPQVHFNNANSIAGKHQVGALVYNPDDGSSWYLASNAYNTDPLYLYRVAISVPSSSILIFGTLDNTINTVLPAKFGQLIYYQGLWSSKTLKFNDLNVTISGAFDLSFTVTQTTVLSAGLDASATFAIGFSGSVSKSSIHLSYIGGADIQWGQYVQDSSAIGGSWILLDTKYVDGLPFTKIEGNGIFGLIPTTSNSTVSAAVGKPMTFYLTSLSVIASLLMI